MRVSKPSVDTLRPFELYGASTAQLFSRLVLPWLSYRQHAAVVSGVYDSGGCHLDGVRRKIAGGLRAHRHEGRRGTAQGEASQTAASAPR